MNQIHQVAPAFMAWIALSGGSHESDAIFRASQSVIGLQRDQQGWEAATKRERLVFGSNKAGDYYEGALPP
ncbi:hypothetical protein [Pseudorhizobium endolithicum]|nr:hypothetical protein [Pseudorhizobium endolithicum]